MISVYWIAFGVDLIIGDPYWFPHPIKLIGKCISYIESGIRKRISSSQGLKISGFFLVIVIVGLSYISVFLLLSVANRIHLHLFYILNIIFLWTTLALKCLKDESKKVYLALKNKDIPLARRQLSYIVGRDTGNLNYSEISKATFETVVENTCDGILAPLFYMFLGGAPLAIAYKAINTLDSMVGYKNQRYLHLGYASAKLDDIANFIPARITGFLLVISSGILRLNMKESYKIMIRDRKNHSSPNCGYPEAAAAGALGIQLGGSHHYFGEVIYKPTIGDEKRNITIDDVKVSIRLMYSTSILALILFSFIFWMVKHR